jgi:hypothetical protein
MKKNYLLNDTAPRIERCLLLLNATFLKGMHRIRSLSLILFSLTFLLVGLSANAQSPDINGGTSWTGWTSNGTALGTSPVIYGRTVGTNGLQDRNFSVYSTAFEFVTGQAIDSSPLGSPGFGAGWLAGDRIIGLGVADFINTTDGTKTLLNAQGGDAIFKFDDKFFPASSVGGTNGFASAGSEFDLIVQLNGDNSVPLQPSNVNSQGRDQTIGSSSGMGSNGPFVSFYKSDGTSMQLFINLDYLARGGWSNNLGTAPAYNLAISTFDGPTYRVVLGFHGMEVVFDAATSATPPPPLAVRVYSDAAETDLVSSHATIQAAIDAATTLDGYVVRVDAGTYTENLTINKRITLMGDGSASTSIQSATSSTPVMTVTGSGLDASNRLVISGLKITGATGSGNPGSGILVVDPTNLAAQGYITFSGLDINGNGGEGLVFNNTIGITDIIVLNSSLSSNTGSGLRIASAVPTFDGLSVSGCTIANNGSSGFNFNPSASQRVGTNFSFTNTNFDTNNTVGANNVHDISMLGFNGSVSFTDVNVNSSNPNYAMVFGGFTNSSTPVSPAGAIVFDGVNVTGNVGKQGILFFRYSEASAVSLTDLDVKDLTAGWVIQINCSHTTGTLNLGNTSLKTLSTGSTGTVNATEASFFNSSNVLLDKGILADNFQIADQFLDKVDLASLGYIEIVAGKSFVTTNSFVAPNTSPSIQRAIDALTTGGTVHVQGGTNYTGGADATASGKDIVLSPGSSPACVTVDGNLTLNSGDVLEIEVSGVTACTEYDQFKVNNGTVTLGGSSLSLDLSYTPGSGDQITIIDGSSAIVGMFAEGTSIMVGGLLFSIDYAGGPDGFDVVLTALDITVRVYSDAAETDLVSSHTTIQAAIDAATTLSGYVVRVDAGTYEEQVVLNKSLSLLGPNAAVAGTGSRLPEAIVQFPAGANNGSSLIFVNPNVHGVTIAGFDLRCQDSTIPNYHQLVRAGGFSAGEPRNDLTIRNNRMYSSEEPIRILAGFGAKGGTGLLIEGNYIDGGPNVNAQFGRGMYVGGTSGIIQDNVIENANYGIQYMPYDNATAGLIQRNTVSASYIGLYNNFQTKGAAQVTWEQNEVTVAPNPQTGTSASVDFAWTTPVVFHGIYVNTFGTQGTGDAPTALFQNNTINAANPGGTTSTVFYAVYLNNSAAGATAILENNSFTGYTVGVARTTGGTQDATAAMVTATCNWWGSSDLATVTTAAGAADSFIPYLNSGTDNDPAIGFQPVPGACVPPCEISSVDASASSTPVPLGSDATLTATVSPAVAGVTVEFYLDGVSVGTAITNGDGIATLGPISGLSVHVYKVEAKVGTCASSVAYLPVFDPSASFVTGGGWITSPEGALTADPNVTGRANFGFVSRYKRGKNGFTSEVDGNTEFQFNAGNLNFESTMHESGSLVISGSRATYRGTGTINGQTGFKFMLVAIDGNWNGQSNPDRFRIKISTTSDVVIYDNELGKDENTEDATILGGGSIVIHEVKGKGKNNRVEDLGTMEEQLNALFENGETELESNKILVYPNPASETSNIKVSLSQDADVTILIFDAAGRLVMEERGYHETSFVRPLNLQGFSNGIYNVVVQINHQFLTKRLVKQ